MHKVSFSGLFGVLFLHASISEPIYEPTHVGGIPTHGSAASRLHRWATVCRPHAWASVSDFAYAVTG